MKSAYIEITNSCNLGCLFCSRKSHESPHYKLSKIMPLIDKYYKMEYRKLHLTGGEPLLHPDLTKMIQHGNQLGFDVVIQTNGTLMTKKRAIELRKAGLNEAAFSIHSHLAIMEDKITNSKGVLKKQLNGLKNANTAGIRTPVTIIINKLNYRILPEFFEFMIKNYSFVEHFSINFIDHVGRARDNSWIVPKLSESELKMMEALLIITKSKKSFRLERVPLCYMLEFAEFNTELRRIITQEPLIAFRDKENLSYLGDYFEKEYTKNESCDVCWLNKICPGVDIHYTELYGTDELYPIFVNPEQITSRSGMD
ncbi:MAG: radical SAM protein [Candidatus Altiarchaeota archaeon]|nr:radical SAM protein [Candidatus Altiarchaeota archaeon]